MSKIQIEGSKFKNTIKLKNLVLEDTIAKIAKDINIKVDIDRTEHAKNRQNRHINKSISDKEIKEIIDLAIPEIAEKMLFDDIDIDKDYILIKYIPTNLNIIGIMRSGSGDGAMDFIVVTVMYKENFKAKPGTHTIIIN